MSALICNVLDVVVTKDVHTNFTVIVGKRKGEGPPKVVLLK